MLVGAAYLTAMPAPVPLTRPSVYDLERTATTSPEGWMDGGRALLPVPTSSFKQCIHYHSEHSPRTRLPGISTN